MDTERQMAAARAYVTSMRNGETPEPNDSACASQPQAEEAPFAFAPAAGITGGGQWLEFAPGPDGLDLRSATGEVFGRLSYAHGGEDRRAHTADQECRLAFERTRGSWGIVARSGDDTPVAAYYPGWRTGGDVWVAPDDWHALRWTPLARGGSWRLSSGGKEILRLRPNGQDHLDMLVEHPPAHPALLLLLVCQIVMAETVPMHELVLGESGGVELAVVSP
jgi:hypothetical protein